MKAPFDAGELKYGPDGLIPIVAQEATTGEVLMLAWGNEDSLRESAKTGRMHYWSRSRQRRWEKGEESGHRQAVVRLAADCDGDAVLALVRQTGPACHENTDTCFGRTNAEIPRPAFAQLAATIAARRTDMPKGSYTAKLLADPKLAAKKIGEEAAELVMALAKESDERVAEEAADLLYHALVAAAGRGVLPEQILDVLEARKK